MSSVLFTVGYSATDTPATLITLVDCSGSDTAGDVNCTGLRVSIELGHFLGRGSGRGQ